MNYIKAWDYAELRVWPSVADFSNQASFSSTHTLPPDNFRISWPHWLTVGIGYIHVLYSACLLDIICFIQAYTQREGQKTFSVSLHSCECVCVCVFVLLLMWVSSYAWSHCQSVILTCQPFLFVGSSYVSYYNRIKTYSVFVLSHCFEYNMM